MSELKPCPRCGSAGEYGINASFNHKRFVNCIVCGIRTAYHDTWDLAVSDWNTRPDDWVMTSERLPDEGVPVWMTDDNHKDIIPCVCIDAAFRLLMEPPIKLDGEWVTRFMERKFDVPPKRWRYML